MHPSIILRKPLQLQLQKQLTRSFAAKAATAEALYEKRDGTKGKIVSERAFIDFKRQTDAYRPPTERVHDWNEIATDSRDPKERTVQAARCMDCGTPFCQTNTGCPVNNLIPEWNELVYRGQWREAIDRLHKTNSFPEFTGRVCPAPCESACCAGVVDDPITIKNNEYAIVNRAWEEGWIVPRIPRRNGLRVAVIGSGPAGLAAADVLNQKGYSVTVYERNDRVGGLLMYGIPNMKLEKKTVDRRVNMLRAEGIQFVTNAEVGTNVSIEQLQGESDAVVLCVGSTVPRDVGNVPGRELKGIHYAMEFLKGNQKRLLLTIDGKLQSGWDKDFITAEGKDVVIIGGGDTGTDCIATSMRHRCKSVVNIEISMQPPPSRAPANPWPEYPRIYGVDYGHAEVRAIFGKDPREYGLMTKAFKGNDKGEVTHVITQSCTRDASGRFVPVPNSEKEYPADLVLFSMGFLHPEQQLMQKLGLEVDQRKNVRAAYGDFQTSTGGVFAAGDCRRGQSLVVWAIHEGRSVADAVEKYFIEEGLQDEVSQTNQRYG